MPADDFDLIPTGEATGERNASRLRERFAEVGGDVSDLQDKTTVKIETLTFAAPGQQTVLHGFGTANVGYRVVCRLKAAAPAPNLWDYAAPDKYKLFLESDQAATYKIEIRVLQ